MRIHLGFKFIIHGFRAPLCHFHIIRELLIGVGLTQRHWELFGIERSALARVVDVAALVVATSTTDQLLALGPWDCHHRGPFPQLVYILFWSRGYYASPISRWSDDCLTSDYDALDTCVDRGSLMRSISKSVMCAVFMTAMRARGS